MPLFWRVCLINGVVFLLGTAALVLSPATVSARPLASEMVVLVVGLAGMAILNGVLLRSLLGPLDQLVAVMDKIDLRQPGLRLESPRSDPAHRLVSGFNAMLGRLEAERSSSTTRALQAQEAERQRIAQELHDEVGQSLTAVLLDLSQALPDAPPSVAAHLRDARETTRRSLEEVRRISQRLRPGVLVDLGLLNSLSSLASDFTARTGVSVQRGFIPGLPELSAETELVVYRVAQEALTNVARHAHADRVQIGLSRLGDRLVLQITDNGRGRVARMGRGSGIRGMHERAQMVGGELDVRSGEGGGTVVELVVPIARVAGEDS